MSREKKSSHKNASRSRHLIKQAFGELLNEKDLRKITVTDIVERANISRGTFYAHYLDVYDLYTAIQNNVLETMEFGLETVGVENLICDPTAAINMGMDFLNANKEYYSLFVNSSHADAFFSRVFGLIAMKCRPFMEEISDLPAAKAETFLSYTLGAYKEVLIRWFNGELDCSSEECADYLISFYMNSRPTELLRFAEQIRTRNETNEGSAQTTE